MEHFLWNYVDVAPIVVSLGHDSLSLSYICSLDYEDDNQNIDDDSDDASFFTAMTHQNLDTLYENDSIMDGSCFDEDAASIMSMDREEYLEMSQELTCRGGHATTTTKSWMGRMRSFCSAAPRRRPFIPRAVQVDKVLVQLQVQVLDLIRPVEKKTRALIPILKPKRRSVVNPYFQVQLHHVKTDVSALLHQSEPYYRQHEAIWVPVQFVLDASIAREMSMVLSIDIYHKQDASASSGKKAKKQQEQVVDEWIGSHQASPWEFARSNDKIPLKNEVRGRPAVTGHLRVVSYEMIPMEKADCWRIFL